MSGILKIAEFALALGLQWFGFSPNTPILFIFL
jgi:hypothetical protein